MQRRQYYGEGSKGNLPFQKSPLKTVKTSLSREILNIQDFWEALYIVNVWNYIGLDPTIFFEQHCSEGQIKNQQKVAETGTLSFHSKRKDGETVCVSSPGSTDSHNGPEQLQA